jgi:hypothetical protein
MVGQSDKAPIRIGITGLGFGVDVHLPAFLGIENVTVTGLLGRDPAAAARVAAKTRLPVALREDFAYFCRLAPKNLCAKGSVGISVRPAHAFTFSSRSLVSTKPCNGDESRTAMSPMIRM